ncbi:MAG: hypothetical protein J1F11_08415, partial [Oscillospiraceae bacterium]|nr:hypothetical protein [Oscillospiraceae bacterium]
MTVKKSLFLRALSLVVAFALTFITVMVFPADVFADEVSGTLQDNITGPDVSIAKNGTTIQPDDAVNDGDKLRVTLSWKVNNDYTITSTESFTMSLGLKNLELSATSGDISLDNSDNVTIGTYQISPDGSITITINENAEEFLSKSERYIKVIFDVQVKLDNSNTPQGGQTDIEIAGTTRKVNPPGDISVNKSRVGDVYIDGGRIYQKYHVEATVTGSVSDVTFTDIHGSGFKGYSDITINPDHGYSFTYDGNLTIDFSNDSLTAGQTISIDYTLEIDEDKFLNRNGTFENTAQFDYKNSEKPEGTQSSSTVWSGDITNNVPSISKTVTPSSISKDELETTTPITWTITVDLKLYKDILESELGNIRITDTMSDNMDIDPAVKAKLDTLTLADFHHEGNGVYTYTYTTYPTAESLDDDKTITFSNRADTTIKDHPFSSGTQVTAKGEVFSKKFDEEKTKADKDGYIWWTLSIYVADAEYEYMTVHDSIFEYGKNLQRLVEDSVTITKPGNVTVSVDSSDIKHEYGEYYDLNFNIDLAKYIADVKGDVITVTYKTEPVKRLPDGTYVHDDDAYDGSFHFPNSAYVNYKIAGGNQESASDSDKYEHTFDKVFEKKAPSNNTSDLPIMWDIEMYDSFARMWEAGHTLTFVDTIPKELVLDEDKGVMFSANNAKANDLAQFIGRDFYVYDPASNTLTINITITQPLVDYLANDMHGSYWPVLTYYTNLKPEYSDWFLDAGSADFSNKAKLTYNDEKMGSSEVTSHLNAAKIVIKGAEYSTDMDKNPKYDSTHVASFGKVNAFFYVDINPSGLLLNDGNDITAIDKMGDDLQLIKASVKVYDPNDPDKVIPYETSFDPNTNTMTYTLPDGVPIRLEYYAAVVGKPNSSQATSSESVNVDADRLENLDINNDIEIIAKHGGTDSKEIPNKSGGYVLSSSGVAGSKDWGVTVYKYTQLDGGKFQPLEGAEFKLEWVEYNNGEWTVKQEVSTGTINEFGELSFSGLYYDHIYCLTETKAPNGYALSEPYYFVHTGFNNVGLPPEVEKVTFGKTLNILNEVSGFSAEKTYEGSAQMSEEQIKALIAKTEFTVSVVNEDDADTDSANAPLIWDETDKKVKINYNFQPGVTYKISETKTPLGFKPSKDIYVKIDNTDGTIKTQYTYSLTDVWKNLASNRLVINNESIKIKISKRAATGIAELKDAVLKLYSGENADESKLLATWTSGTTPHEIDLSKLTNLTANTDGSCTFTLVEDIAPAGYVKLETKFVFTVDKDGNVSMVTTGEECFDVDTDGTVILKNKALKTTVTVNKDWVGVPSGTSLPESVTVKLIDKDDSSKTFDPETITLNETNGWSGKWENLPVGGKYTVKELNIPQNYKVSIVTNDTDPYNITAAVTNTYLTKVQLNKTALNGTTPLENAELVITDSDGEEVDRWTTDANGLSDTFYLENGTYTLTETVAPAGYKRVTSTFTFTVENGNVTGSVGSTTNGDYEINNDGDYPIIIIKDSPLDEIQLIKRFTDDHLNTLADKPAKDAWLKNTAFTLYDVTDSATPSEANKVGSPKNPVWDDDKEEAVVTFDGKLLQAGRTYCLKETTVPQGYTSNSVFYFKIDNDGNMTYTVFVDGVKTESPDNLNGIPICTNTYIILKADVQFKKAEKTDQSSAVEKVVPGAAFKLTTPGGGEITLVSNDDGYLYVTEGNDVFTAGTKKFTLEPGTYTLTETAAPDGYVVTSSVTFIVDDEGKIAEVTKAQTNGVYEITNESGTFVIKVMDAPIKDIKLIKTYSDGYLTTLTGDDAKNKWLENTKFTLTDVTDSGNPVPVGEPKSPIWNGERAEVSFEGSGLIEGHTYELKETQPPNGYVMSSDIFECTIGPNGTIKYKNKNTENITDNGAFPSCDNKKITIQLIKEYIDSEEKPAYPDDSVIAPEFALHVPNGTGGYTRVSDPLPVKKDSKDNKYRVTFDWTAMNDGYPLQAGSVYYLKEVTSGGKYPINNIIFKCTVQNDGTVKYDIVDGTKSEKNDGNTDSGFPVCINKETREEIPELKIHLDKKWLNKSAENSVAGKTAPNTISKVTISVKYNEEEIGTVDLSANEWKGDFSITLNGAGITSFSESELSFSEKNYTGSFKLEKRLISDSTSSGTAAQDSDIELSYELINEYYIDEKGNPAAEVFDDIEIEKQWFDSDSKPMESGMPVEYVEADLYYNDEPVERNIKLESKKGWKVSRSYSTAMAPFNKMYPFVFNPSNFKLVETTQDNRFERILPSDNPLVIKNQVKEINSDNPDDIKLIKTFEGNDGTPELEAIFGLYSDCDEDTGKVNGLITSKPAKWTGERYEVKFTKADGIASNNIYFLKEEKPVPTGYDLNPTVFKCEIDNTGNVTYSVVKGTAESKYYDVSGTFPICNNFKEVSGGGSSEENTGGSGSGTTGGDDPGNTTPGGDTSGGT